MIQPQPNQRDHSDDRQKPERIARAADPSATRTAASRSNFSGDTSIPGARFWGLLGCRIGRGLRLLARRASQLSLDLETRLFEVSQALGFFSLQTFLFLRCVPGADQGDLGRVGAESGVAFDPRFDWQFPQRLSEGLDARVTVAWILG